MLKREGHEVKVLDFHNYRTKKNQRLDKALESKPDVIGISMKSFTLDNSLRIIKHCKKKHRAIYIAGGTHISLERGEFFSKSGVFDYLVLGEGELTVVDLLNALEHNKSVSGVNGIAYKDNGKIRMTPERKFVKNLDDFPFPDYDVFDSVADGIFSIAQQYPMMTSRGCPFDCTFCLSKELWKRKWRARSPNNVVNEIQNAKEKYNIKFMEVWDDNFTLDIGRAEKICDLIVSRGLDVKWACPNGVRADKINKELLIKMKEAGCISISIAVESGDSEVFKCIKKGETLQSIERAAHLIKQAGLDGFAFFIIGLPHDTPQTVQNSIRFAKKIGFKTIWHQAIPFPHTELADWVAKNGNVLRTYEGECLWESHIRQPIMFDTKEFTEKQRIESYYKAILACGNYYLLYSPADGFVERMNKVSRIIMKYDRKNILNHLANLLYRRTVAQK